MKKIKRINGPHKTRTRNLYWEYQKSYINSQTEQNTMREEHNDSTMQIPNKNQQSFLNLQKNDFRKLDRLYTARLTEYSGLEKRENRKK